MNIKAAICDDNQGDRENLKAALFSYYMSSNTELSVDLYASGKELLEHFKTANDYQLLLLDIEMPEISGIQIAEQIRSTIDKHVIIIFISNYSQYMQDSFRVRPFYYITKPFRTEDIYNLMNNVVKEIESSHIIYSLISTEKGSVTINIKDLLFIEASDSRNNVLTFHFSDHSINTKGTISHWQKQLKDYNFCQCYRSILINLLHIHYFEKGSIILDNGKSVPISRRKEKELKSLYLNTTMKLLNL